MDKSSYILLIGVGGGEFLYFTKSQSIDVFFNLILPDQSVAFSL